MPILIKMKWRAGYHLGGLGSMERPQRRGTIQTQTFSHLRKNDKENTDESMFLLRWVSLVIGITTIV